MENNYQNLQYTDDEKAVTYVKSIIKAVDMTHQVTEKSKIKSRKAREAIETKDKEFINTTDIMRTCSVGMNFYNQVTVMEIERQLKMMIGVIYDYEAKHCLHNDTIQQCLKKLLKASGVFTDKEIEILLR